MKPVLYDLKAAMHTGTRQRHIAAAYRPGMPAPVFHDGKGRSVLRQGVRAPSWFTLVLAGGASLWLAAITVYIVLRVRDAVRRGGGHVLIGAARP